MTTPKVHRPSGATGGDLLQVESGGEIEVKSGGALDVQSGATVKLLDTTALTATGAEINSLHSLAAGKIVVGSATNVPTAVAVIGDATLSNTGVLTLAVPKVAVLSEAVAVGDFTDNTDATGYKDLTAKLPAGAIPLGWKFVGSGAFDGDGSAVIQVGVDGDLDRFSADTAGSVFAVATVGSSALAADACKGIAAEVTVRVTVTTGSAFATCKAANHGAGTLNLYYIDTE